MNKIQSKIVANRLYSAGIIDPRIWASLFRTKELVALWKNCQKNLDIGYDDEVYEALVLQGYKFI